MNYTIEHDNSKKREGFGEYNYRILLNGQFVASYRHDYRGDDHELVFVDGTVASSPVGRMTDFVEGGGPRPLILSALAVAYLERRSR